MKFNLFKTTRKIHKWLGYCLVLQVFFWLLGGLVMSAIPLEKVHGKHLAQKKLDNPFKKQDYSASLDFLKQTEFQVESIYFDAFLNSPIYRVQTSEGELVFDAKTGMALQKPTQLQIKQRAKQHYLGDGELVTSEYLENGPREVGFKQKVWRVSFNDLMSTTLYFYADTGQFITVRSTIWRIFDFFWMLHIMDYDERENFNNPLLISFSAAAVLFCLSGFILLLQGASNKKRRLMAYFKK